MQSCAVQRTPPMSSALPRDARLPISSARSPASCAPGRSLPPDTQGASERTRGGKDVGRSKAHRPRHAAPSRAPSEPAGSLPEQSRKARRGAECAFDGGRGRRDYARLDRSHRADLCRGGAAGRAFRRSRSDHGDGRGAGARKQTPWSSCRRTRATVGGCGGRI
jgi:hypothetical protein